MLRSDGVWKVLGGQALFGATGKEDGANGKANGVSNGIVGDGKEAPVEKGMDTQDKTKTGVPWKKTLPFLLLQVSIFQTIAGPIGFLALRHISYPTMVLGKVCPHIPISSVGQLSAPPWST
jgi:UDP-galactose transporter B1